jgi:hypothetical protein
MTLVDPTNKKSTFTLNGVLYVLDLALISNGNYPLLLSVLVATNRGCRFEFTQSCDILWTLEGSVFETIKSKGMVWLPTIQQSVVTVPTTLLSKHRDYDTIHRRCCHIGDETIRKKSTLGVKGILANCTYGLRAFYRSCVVAKSNVANINRESTRSNDPNTFFTYLQLTFGDQSALLQLATSLMSLVLYVINLRLLWQN